MLQHKTDILFSRLCSLLFYRMENLADTPVDEFDICKQMQQNTSTSQQMAANICNIFTCSVCYLKEHYDYKGMKPPFARQLIYLEECYIMKDPFSLPNRGEVLVLGADCSICKRIVCLRCSIFYGQRLCLKCASNNMQKLPLQLHDKINNLIKHEDCSK